MAGKYRKFSPEFHHTQLLAALVAEGKITPATAVEEKITYHDPCFLGRHNKVFTPPRAIIDAVPGTTAEEMPRCKNRGFCCGAGGAGVDGRADRRLVICCQASSTGAWMWMEP
jgi:Fe-S oxidoreductase